MGIIMSFLVEAISGAFLLWFEIGPPLCGFLSWTWDWFWWTAIVIGVPVGLHNQHHGPGPGASGSIDAGGGKELQIMWKSENLHCQKEMNNQKIHLVDWNNVTGIAKGCYDSSPDLCCEMHNFFISCDVWSKPDLRPNGLGDGALLMTGVQPNGTVTGSTPKGKVLEDAEWMIPVDDTLMDVCFDHWQKWADERPWLHIPKEKPYTPYCQPTPALATVSGQVLTPGHGPLPITQPGLGNPPDPCQTATPSNRRRDVHEVKRDTAQAADEISAFFTKLPSNDILHNVSSQGAALIHRHLAAGGRDYRHHVRVLQSAMSSVMNMPKLVRRDITNLTDGVDTFQFVTTLHEHILQRTPEDERNGMEVLANGAVGKAMRKRFAGDQVGLDELRLMRWIFNRVRGPSKVMLERQKMAAASNFSFLEAPTEP